MIILLWAKRTSLCSALIRQHHSTALCPRDTTALYSQRDSYPFAVGHRESNDIEPDETRIIYCVQLPFQKRQGLAGRKSPSYAVLKARFVEKKLVTTFKVLLVDFSESLPINHGLRPDNENTPSESSFRTPRFETLNYP